MDKPKIRFQGFEEAWCEKTLGEIAEFFDYGLNVSAKKYDGINKYLRITDIDETSRLFVLDNIASPNTDIRKVENYKLRDQDIVFARTGASVGKTYIYNVIDGDVYFAGFLIRARIPLKYSAQFVFQKTLTEDYKKFVASTSQRSGQPGINANEYSAYKCFTPSLPEQEKIGKLFQRIDHLLNLQQRKCDKLKDIKKSMLTKMFPKPGKKVPEVRFEGFTDDWVECKLGEIAEIKTGYPFSSQEFSPNGKYLVITNGNIQDSSSYVDGAIGNRITINNQQILNEYILNTNDILVTMDGSVGRTAKVKDSCQILAQRVGRVIPKRDKEFIYQLLNNGSFSESMENLAHGGTIKHISLSEISSYKNLISRNLSEQQKIGKLFERLDHLISLNELRLDKLRLLKRSFLEGMFV